MNYFEYNGIRSSDMGLHIQRKNVYSSPKYDSSFVSIPGRNGNLIVPNRRYENTQVSYSVYLSAKNSQQLADSITKSQGMAVCTARQVSHTKGQL